MTFIRTSGCVDPHCFTSFETPFELLPRPQFTLIRTSRFISMLYLSMPSLQLIAGGSGVFWLFLWFINSPEFDLVLVFWRKFLIVLSNFSQQKHFSLISVTFLCLHAGLSHSYECGISGTPWVHLYSRMNWSEFGGQRSLWHHNVLEKHIFGSFASPLPLPGWQPGQEASWSSGSPPQAHWFCWYWSSGDCRCTMWWGSLYSSVKTVSN